MLLSAAEFFKKASQAVYLYKNIWKESTTTLLHASRETDKTAEAIEIASDIAAKGRPVAYIACESRINSHKAALSKAPANLSICVPSFDSADDKTDYADLVISTIEEIVATTSIRTFVIDSVTRIAALSFGRNASAAYVMKRLVVLQLRCRLSLLVISHDTTRATDRTLLTLADSEIIIAPDETESAQKEKTKTDPSRPMQTDNIPRSQSRDLSGRPINHVARE